MPRISHREFQQELDALSAEPGAIQHAVQDGGTLAPVDRLPAPTVPNSRRNTRSLPRVPNPIGIIGNVVDAVCIPYSLAPETTVRTLRRSTVGFVADRIWENATQNTVQRMCRDTPGFVPPSPSPDFAGGQCPGVRYEVRVGLNVQSGGNCDTDDVVVVSRDIVGPISDIRVLPSTGVGGEEAGIAQAFGRAIGEDLTAPQRWIDIGKRQNFGGCNPGAPVTIASIQVTRRDGLPDTCGNVPPRYRDNGDIVLAPDIDIDIGVDTPIRLSPTVTADVNGTINIDISDFANVSIDVGGIDINFTPSPNDPDSPDQPPLPPEETPPPSRPDPGDTSTDPDSPSAPPPPDEPAATEPPEQAESVIRAALVTVTSVSPAATEIYQSGNPNVYVPDLGLLSFRCRASDSSSGWTEDIRIKNVRQFVTCPWEGGAFDVKGTPREGVAWTIEPVYDRSSLPVQSGA